MEFSDSLKKNITSVIKVSSNQVLLYWKGRVALYAYLKALGIQDDDEVIVPGLTCVVVPNAILYAGAIPVYADIRLDTLTMDPNKIGHLITKKTKAIIIQNTFGLSADVDLLVRLARDKGIAVIEDCTHGFGGFFDGKPNGTIADAAFYSTQWNKPFSTGLGGVLVVNRQDMISRVQEVNQELLVPKWKEVISLRLCLFAHAHVLTDRNYWRCVNLFRLLSRTGLVTGSSSADELASLVMPLGYFKGMSNVQLKEGIKTLSSLHHVLKQRQVAALAFREVLLRHGRWCVPKAFDANNSHLKFPVLVRDRARFIKLAEHARVRVSDWFISPIHPIRANFERWHLDVRTLPIATETASKLVSINTEVEHPEKVCDFLENNIGLIE